MSARPDATRNAAVELLAALTMHHSPLVRRAALAAAVEATQKLASWGTALAACLLRWLREGPPAGIAVDPTAEDPALSESVIARR